MERIKRKNQIQEKAVNYSKSYYCLLLNWATGCGKSLAAIKTMKAYNKPIYIVVAETNHINNWEKEFIKHGYKDLLENVTIFCYASIKKYKGTKDTIWVFDEAHHITDKKMAYFRKAQKPYKILLLSATLPYKKKILYTSYLYKVGGKLGNYNISLIKAIKWGLLPKPKITIFSMDMPKYLESNYEALGRDIDNIKSALVENNSKQLVKRLAFKYIERKNLIGEAKTETAVKILDTHLENKRKVIFSNSKNQSYLLAGFENSKWVINSNNTKKQNERTIEEFNTEKGNSLYAVNMLREGMNLSNIEAALIVQLDSAELNLIQQLGRVLRSDLPELYILVYKDTIDEKYIEQNTKSLEEFITIKKYKHVGKESSKSRKTLEFRSIDKYTLETESN